MNWFENILYLLKLEMNEPMPFGWFHLMWIGFVIVSLVLLFLLRKKYSDKQLKWVLGIYGIVALLLELVKQLMWSMNYDHINNVVIWDYEWYAAPFQLCTTPIFVSLMCLFMKENKLRNALLSYMAFVTILGSFVTILLPETCFVNEVVINIHTMWLHCGSFVVSVYLLMNGAVKINFMSLRSALKTFLFFVCIAELLNISVYNMGILNGEEFNMFYISPYFETTLPVFSYFQQNLPFIIYLLMYILVVFIGAYIVFGVSKLIDKLSNKKNKHVIG